MNRETILIFILGIILGGFLVELGYNLINCHHQEQELNHGVSYDDANVTLKFDWEYLSLYNNHGFLMSEDNSNIINLPQGYVKQIPIRLEGQYNFSGICVEYIASMHDVGFCSNPERIQTPYDLILDFGYTVKCYKLNGDLECLTLEQGMNKAENSNVSIILLK